MDHEIFEGSGNPQFEVYRDMQAESQKDWSKFCPTTNVLWLKFLAGWLGRNINSSKTSARLIRFSSSSSLPHSSEEFLSLFISKFKNTTYSSPQAASEAFLRNWERPADVAGDIAKNNQFIAGYNYQ